MKVKPLPSRERLDELLNFNPDTGEITYKIDGNNQYVKLGNLAGKIYTKMNGIKYYRIKIDGIYYLLHRLAHYYWTNEQPIEVDHINGNSLDNRKDNLRAATNGLNQRNKRMYKTNTSGVIGVNYNKRDKLWCARYGSNELQKKHKTFAHFKTFDEAVAKRKMWEDQFGMTEAKKHRGS